MTNPRARLAAGVLVLAAVATAALLALTAGGRDGDEPVRVARATLLLEQATRPDTGQRELIVSLPDAQLNSLETTDGAQVVSLRCADGAGAEALSRPVDWPLLEEAGYPPHTHEPVEPRILDAIRSCRLTGPGIDFDASVPGPLPAAQ